MGWSKDDGNGRFALEAGEFAQEQGNIAKAQAERAEKVATENKTRFLGPVATFAALATTYPNPQNGDSVRVTSEAAMYRFQTGSGWVKTDEYNPTAINEVAVKLAEEAQEIEALKNSKAEKNYVDTRLSEKAGKDEVFTMANMGQDIKETMTGGSVAVVGRNAVLTENIVSKQVTASKTSFAKGGGGINLWDGSYVRARLVGSTGYVFSESVTAFAIIIMVTPGKTYNVYKSRDTDIFRVGAFKTYPKANDSTSNIKSSSSGTRITITTAADENYLVVYVSSETQALRPTELQVSEGAEDKPYVSPDKNIIINLSDESIPTTKITKTDFHRRSKNLFDGAYQPNFIISSSGALAHGSAAGMTAARTTYAIECESKTAYVLSGEFDRTRWRFEDTDKNFLSTADATSVVSPVGARYMYLYYSTNGTHEKLQIEKGTEPTYYNKPYVIDEEYLPVRAGGKSDEIILLGDDGSRYTVGGEYFELNTSDEVYSGYDSLVSQYPKLITKEQIGASTKNIPINTYTFKTNKTEVIPGKKLKVLLITGTHGQEKITVRGTLRFLQDLCSGWKTQRALSFLLSNVELTVIPLLNPDGMNAGTRVNGNGVDLNRNFPKDWTYNAAPNNYTGETPASEVETQLLMSYLADHQDLYFVVDFHNYNPYPATSNTLMWVGADDIQTQRAIRSWGQAFDLDLRKMFADAENQGNNLIAVRDRGSLGTYNGGTSRYMESVGLKAVTLEAVENINGNQQNAQILNASGVGNFLLDMIRSYRVLT